MLLIGSFGFSLTVKNNAAPWRERLKGSNETGVCEISSFAICNKYGISVVLLDDE